MLPAEIISAHADRGPCSRVRARKTLRSAPHRHERTNIQTSSKAPQKSAEECGYIAGRARLYFQKSAVIFLKLRNENSGTTVCTATLGPIPSAKRRSDQFCPKRYLCWAQLTKHLIFLNLIKNLNVKCILGWKMQKGKLILIGDQGADVPVVGWAFCLSSVGVLRALFHCCPQPESQQKERVLPLFQSLLRLHPTSHAPFALHPHWFFGSTIH